jgi:ketosteroid isomerase-like protein
MAFDGEDFIRRFMDAWDRHDIAAIDAMFTEDAIFEASFGPEPWGNRAIGKPACVALAREVFERIPDVRFEHLRHHVTADFAVVEELTTGTPVGGTRFEVQLCDVLTLRDGKVASKRSYRKVRM